jgi:ribosomal protein L17
MKVREIELKMNRNLMAVGCDVRTCVLSVYYIDTVYNKAKRDSLAARRAVQAGYNTLDVMVDGMNSSGMRTYSGRRGGVSR